MKRWRTPISEGTAIAVLAAVLFGVTTPVIRWAGVDAGPFPTAALLYVGAALASLRPKRSAAPLEAPVRRQHLGRLVAVALLGGALAPALFAWGVQRTSGTAAALLLNFEALFTALLGWMFFREGLGRRVAVALALMLAAGGLLAWSSAATPASSVSGAGSTLGAVAVVLATLAWALDNVLTRPLADLDPLEVVRGKGLVGSLVSVVVALTLGQPFPGRLHALALVVCGATGYGLSLRLYLLAQRRIGAGRTGSLFALAPFVGAAAAWAAGEGHVGNLTLAAGGLFGVAIYLHATESHGHRHTHPPVRHEHAHGHDDGHHDHRHESEVAGGHSHPHAHDERTHEHPHGPDAHHEHSHDS